jgi:hypothetical protein
MPHEMLQPSEDGVQRRNNFSNGEEKVILLHSPLPIENHAQGRLCKLTQIYRDTGCHTEHDLARGTGISATVLNRQQASRNRRIMPVVLMCPHGMLFK